MNEHYADCATNNEPMMPAGPCDCGGYPSRREAIADVVWHTVIPHTPHGDAIREAIIDDLHAAGFVKREPVATALYMKPMNNNVVDDAMVLRFLNARNPGNPQRLDDWDEATLQGLREALTAALAPEEEP